MISRKKQNTRSKRISKNRLKMRQEFWPDIDLESLYDKTKESGWTTIPRTLPLICRIMDDLSSGKPVSSTYLSLWCRVFDEGIIVLKNPHEVAFESGFSGERAVTTWRNRMKILVEFGFIEAKEGSTGDFHYILLLHPHKVIERLKNDNKIIQMATYNAYYERLVDIGAINLNEE